MSHRLVPRIAALALVGSLGFAGTAFAAGGGDGTGPTGDKAAKVCANLDQIDDWMNSRITEVQHRIEYFTTMRGKAEAAGREKLVARIDSAITRLNDRLARLQNRVSQLDTWAAEHCTTTTTVPTPAPEDTTTTVVVDDTSTTLAG